MRPWAFIITHTACLIGFSTGLHELRASYAHKAEFFALPGRDVFARFAPSGEDVLERLVEEDELKEIHVAYASTRSFTGLLSSMISLAVHLHRPSSCTIHVIVGQGDMEQAKQVVVCFAKELSLRGVAKTPKVRLVEVQPVPFNNSRSAQQSLNGMDVVYSRLYLPHYLPGVRRALWLDTDTIIRSDVSPLFRMPLRNVLAAVLQEDAQSTFEIAYGWRENLAQFTNKNLSSANIFNDGVLLLDLRQWAERNFSAEIESLTHKLVSLFDDELLLNVEFQFRHSFDKLDMKWNTYNLGCKSYRWSRDVLERAKILHWSGGWKPWTKRNKSKMVNGQLRSWIGRASFLEYYTPYKPREECLAAAAPPPEQLHL